jgi:glycosyltransferase involved in cell wall biosynthesis
MKIGFIAEPYEEKNASGMGYLILELLRNLPIGKDDTLIIYSSKPIKKEVIPTPHINVIVPKGLIGKFFYFLRFKGDVDVMLFVAPLLPLLLPRRIKAVVLCQELGSQKTPVEGFSNRVFALVRDQILMKLCLARATIIVSPSLATKVDVHTYYNVPDKKVVVVYDGYQDLTQIAPASHEFTDDKKPFFFFTGRVKRRKNVHSIVSAFIKLVERTGATCNVVIAGGHGGEYHQAMLQELREHNLEHRVFFLGYVSINELVALFRNAVAFIFPSYNEGFGMPPLEAMSFGLPVITSNISSTAEVVGEAGLLVDPYSVDEISHAMEQLLTDEALRQELIARGYERCKEFSWQKAGRELMAVLQGL